LLISGEIVFILWRAKVQLTRKPKTYLVALAALLRHSFRNLIISPVAKDAASVLGGLLEC